MGYNVYQWDFLKSCLEKYVPEDKGTWMLELGNQRIKRPVLKRDGLTSDVSKDYFIREGFNHVSFDINENDGAINIDLSKDMSRTEFFNKFDVITNSGTTEHVEPYKRQYECFRNIHRCAKVGGLFIHIVPEAGGFKDHCQNYYTLQFFEDLAKANNYDILELDRHVKSNGSACLVCLKKKEDNIFCENKKEILKNIINVPYSKKALAKFKKQKSYRYTSIKKENKI